MSVPADIQGLFPLRPGETAAEYSARIFGGRTRIEENDVTIGTTSTEVIKGNPRRVFWLVVNNGANEGFLGFKNTVAANAGVDMGPRGGFSSMTVFEDGEGVAQQVWGIQTIASANWHTIEVMQI